MANIEDKTPDSPEDQIKKLQKENNRLQRIIKRHETQLQHLDKMASANEKTNIALYKELEVLQQQAEAQAREAQIEAALERVRSRTMAMRNSDELAETAGVLFEQMVGLGIVPKRCVIGIIDSAGVSARLWFTSSGGKVISGSDSVPLTEHENLVALFQAWKNNEQLYTFELVGEARATWTRYVIEKAKMRLPEYQPDKIDRRKIVTEPAVFNSFFFSHGFLMLHTVEHLTETDVAMLKRFARVFEQTYTRFLDLQKAEAQAREAQIEAALERVRAKAMAMHKSDDLNAAVATVFEELDKLNLGMSRCGIGILDKEKRCADVFTTSKSEQGCAVHVAGDESMDIHPLLQGAFDAWVKQQDFSYVLQGEDLAKYYSALGGTNFRLPESPAMVEQADKLQQHYYVAPFQAGALFAFRESAFPEEAKTVMKRFAGVFNLTYKRFLDIQKAEAQAREAQIEAALERVRSRSMGMQKSEELKEVIQLVYEQFVQLKIHVEHTGFIMDYKTRDDYNSWIADKFGTPSQVTIPYFDCVYYNRFNEAKEKGEDFFATNLSFEEKNKFYQDLFKIVPGLPEDALEFLLSCPGLALSTVLLDNVALYIENLAGTSYTDDENAALMRFGKVFQQTYTRFLDLQKAEAQAREAQIEAALERVRARAMAMHHSDDLDKVNKEILNQLNWLQVPNLTGVTFYLIDEHGWVKAWDFSSPGNMGNPNSYALQYDFQKYEIMGEPFKILRQTDLNYFVADYPLEKLERAVYELEEINPAVANVFKEALANGILTHQWTACARISDGMLGVDLVSPPSEDTKTIVLKIAGAFNQAYQRFLDLQRAEAQARQALQQASLERVRAEIASMRTTEDLQRITPLIWRELTTLGVPFFRCGVFIINEATALAHVYLSTPAGEAVAALHLKFDSAPVVNAAVQNWRQQQVYREEWSREQFTAWTQSILKQGLIDSSEKYQAGGEAPEKLVLHFVPFTQGMLYIGSSAALADDEIAIGQALANAFGVAYARYEDFQRLEAAKAQIEAALDNLKKTQGRLVQAEKMASLGQLTAGIAHEIKNPLNFVNNFAALSVDLAKELREEIVKRKTKNVNGDDFADVEEILAMLEQNAEKINHHGKRADGIVHAMMQHARGGKGERQPTDVNKLVEEYLNLSYHGMRAKVPDFNVTIEQDFGELDGKIEMVPQDIGRVLLNLLGNAFDAVREKAQSGDKTYSPSVTVSTRAVGGAVEIRVRDNGNGIPDEVREKIFEPFFTTKPTGSGTGLGLSLSFDIVTQGHGGMLSAESTQGEGATFVVTLPVK